VKFKIKWLERTKFVHSIHQYLASLFKCAYMAVKTANIFM